MKYGFAVIEIKHERDWYGEYSIPIPKVLKVRTFKTMSERDNGIRLEENRRDIKGLSRYVEFSKFVTK